MLGYALLTYNVCLLKVDNSNLGVIILFFCYCEMLCLKKNNSLFGVVIVFVVLDKILSDIQSLKLIDLNRKYCMRQSGPKSFQIEKSSFFILTF